MTYCFVYQMSYEDTIRETSIEIVGDETKSTTTETN